MYGRILLVYQTWLDQTRLSRDLAFRAYKENSTKERWKIYCKCRNKVTSLLKKSKREFAESYNIVNQPGCVLWKKIKALDVLKDVSNETCSFTPNDLNDHFARKNPVCTNPTDHKLENFQIEKLEKFQYFSMEKCSFFSQFSMEMFWIILKNSRQNKKIPVKKMCSIFVQNN